jgi:hypothetical protein
MSGTPLQKKLSIRPGQKHVFLNAPSSFHKALGQIPRQITVGQKASTASYDYVLMFANNITELEENFPTALKCLANEEGHLWVAYPKGTAKIKTDLNRDHGWNIVNKNQYHPVTQIAIDDTWSALRFKLTSQIKKMVRGGQEVIPGVDNTKKTITLSQDFLAALKKSPRAWKTFESFAFTHKKEYVRWIEEAKKDDTRKKRIERAILMLEQGKKYAS